MDMPRPCKIAGHCTAMTTNDSGLNDETYAVLRVGRKVGRTIYLQTGTAPSDGDLLIGLMDTSVLAAAVVDAVNAAWVLTEWFTDQAAHDPDDEDAAQWLDLLRPIWAAGWVPGGPRGDHP